MTQDNQTDISSGLQQVILSTSVVGKNNREKELQYRKIDKIQDFNDVSDGRSIDDFFELDSLTFDKWVPLLRKSIEAEQLHPLVDNLYNSIDDHFEGLETQLLQDAQISDKLKTSIPQISNIQDIIEGSLSADISNLQNALTKSTTEVILKKEVYLNNKKISSKVKETSILISKVLRILELANNCQDLIIEKNFFKALQNIETLEQIYLQEFKNYNFQFLNEIYGSIPFLKSSIKDECVNLIKNSFNLNLGKNLLTVGDQFFQVYRDELLPVWIEVKDTMKLGNFKFNSPIEISLRDQNITSKLNLSNFFDLDEFHDSILIFQKLNEFDYLFTELTTEYAFRKNKIIHPLSWKNATNGISNTPGSSGNTGNANNSGNSEAFQKLLSVKFLKEYFLKLLGFLLYDINLNRATDYIIVCNNYNATNEFWDGIMQLISPSLEYFVQNILNTEEELTEFKDFMCIFIAILENYELNIDSLYAFLISIFKKFCKLATNAFEEEFQVLLNDDDFMPLTINDRQLYEKVTKICWMKDSDDMLVEQNGNDDDFIVTLPFSPLYPMTCTLIKKTYTKLISFISSFFRHELHTVNSILVTTVDHLFNDIVNHKIRAKLDTTSREEIAQILINLDYFIIAANKFSKLMETENIMQNPDIGIKLSSINNYEESRKQAESQLIELIDNKVSDILETVELDWNATVTREEPDFSIVDIAQFLEMMFSSTLVNLPYSVQTLLIFREFDSLTTQFLNILLHETPAKITKESVLNFEVDIKYLKSIISRIFPSSDGIEDEENDLNGLRAPPTPISQVNNSIHSPSLIENNIKSLKATFTELEQCLDLLKLDNVEEYSDPEIRMRRFARIRPDDASILLNKVKPITSQREVVSASRDSTSPLPMESLNTHRIAKFFKNKK
ncbi:hypothetical protein TPHA_0E02450 [Tetrapisispora phaffii CBS 4417]|uniref:Exocyst complex component SEC15 n=1 Tax=Tetrapisispora phaffii (strain ATCC 24235 / CBS 4417 / NBRC 1672 / NRRL Y-8282 / UCD 70-5) TaxID=1071381 RepID=G8BTV9_TETPH|nr:hypothetical protein TPHA_0E02450 [Tetrapisispora phaffii CBS 4417]CCE63337.1 hypothetical protein TPHA_0E02450 [Tetrapisispora phaffii CBS 4417]